MITKQQWRIIHEIDENKAVYLSFVKDKKTKTELIELYDKFKMAVNDYALKISDEAIARAGYQGALKSHKFDSSIAGGIANGAAGIGAGLHTAHIVDQKNKQIDRQREEYKSKVFDTSQIATRSEAVLISVTMEIYNKLDSVEQIREYKEKQIEELYNSAKKYIEKKEYKRAEEIIETIPDYKDAQELLGKVKYKSHVKGTLIMVVIATVFALIITAISGVWMLFGLIWTFCVIAGIFIRASLERS